MKFLIKIFAFSFLVCSVLYICSSRADAAALRRKESAVSILVVGFDTAPSNTDVLSVLSYDSESNTLNALQIPRDTYIRYGEKSGKINGLYSYYVGNGASHAEALSSLCDTVSEALGVRLDGCVSFNREGFIETVDFLGGVDIYGKDLPQVLSFKEDDDGRIHFDGKEAFDLVRYRKEYQRGDLERLDVQKVFLKAFFEKLKGQREIFSLFKSLSGNENIYLSLDRGFYSSMLLENIFRARSADIQIATLPGKSVKLDNIWYYSVLRNEAEALVKGYFPYTHRDFDINNYFIDVN